MTEAAPGASPAVDLSHLRQHHLALMADPLKKASGQECESFVRDLIDAGRDVAPGRDREALRKMLYFWTAEAVSRGDRPRGELPTLLPYSGKALAQAEKGGPLLTAPIGAEQIEATAETRTAIRIGALARQWRVSGHDAGYLLNGDALKEATTLTGVDPEIDQFIEASRKRVRRQTIAAASFSVVAVGLIAIAAIVLAVYYRGLSKDLQDALDERKTAFQQLSAASSRESAATRNEARRAIEALNAGGDNPLGPLKKLLERIGDAQQDELNNLAVKSTQPTNTTLYGNTVQGPAQVIQRAPPELGTCDGVLWLGNDSNRLISGTAPLASLQGNETVKVNNDVNIRLRNGMPSAAYVMAPQIGLVPGGASLVLTGKPEVHRSPNGTDQYFAPVKAPQEFCTRVYVQYFGDSAKVQNLRTDLGNLGFEVPQAQRLDSAKQLAEVRIFQAADRPMAKLVGSTLKTFNNGKDLTVRELFNFPGKPAAGTIEVWIDLSRP